ncbi:S-adenosyl-L-methionine-dependent methyltransferase [Hortaea werneckii]|nr:S-adenosyl-L-methionine-dependent methyltransferase [Hortaea werneckii]
MTNPSASSENGSGTASRRLLDPSELGTKEYWDDAYARELENQEQDADEEGTVWFSESGAEEAILKQLESLEDEGLLDRQTTRFLDLGTGNGHLLFCLREDEDEDSHWLGAAVGVDYSEPSIQLARRIASQKDLGDTVRFELWDLLTELPGTWSIPGGFEVVLDKGTFDAISLMPQESSHGLQAHPCEVYRKKVEPLIKAETGFLIITSCNWTKDEVLEWLAPENGELEYYAEAKYPTFTFGGQTGQSIVTLVLRRKAAQA